MNALTVVIPSRSRANLEACVAAVRENEPDCEIIVVWDQSRGNSETVHSCKDYRVVLRFEEFIYARNCNAGINFACPNDVILLNDDALLQTRGGFTSLQKVASLWPEFGLIGAVTNVTGMELQRGQAMGLRTVPRMVPFMCVYIPRTTIDTVGLLDEEFVGYGFEDDSYCLRTRRAGLKVGVYDFCYVDHGSLTSTFRGGTYPHAGFQQNKQIFVNKYGGYPL